MLNPSISKYLYKTFLIVTKYIPIILALVFVTTLIFNYLGKTVPILAYFGGVSFVFIGLLYLMSFVFQFCHLYRIPLHYVTIGNSIGIADTWLHFPISAMGMYRIYFTLTGIMVVAYIWFMYKNRNNPKIDHIKQLCDNYC